MKKLMMMAAAGMMMATAAFAQTTAAPKTEKTPDDIAAKRSAVLKEKLALTDDQTAQVKTLIADNVTKVRAIKSKYTADNKKGMGKELKPVRDEYLAKMKTILTPDQYTKWEQMKADAKARHKEHKGGASGDAEEGLDF